LPERQWHRRIRARPGATVLEVIRQSGVLTAFPEIDVAHAKLGIFSRRTNLEQRVRSGDRVEIYRPLKTDPKSARRLRARGEDRA
jgi:putative ubiquitin-RnfH superfamily antitoxin RatB of RatAB toxin-antitoxin module